MFIFKPQEVTGNDSQGAGHYFQQQEVRQEKPGLLKQAPTLSYMSLTNTQPGSDQIHSYTMKGHKP